MLHWIKALLIFGHWTIKRLRRGQNDRSINSAADLLLTWVSGALTWDSMPGILTLFLCRYFKKTSAFRLANVHACEDVKWEHISTMMFSSTKTHKPMRNDRITLRKASFCSRCLLIMGVTWSDSLFGPSLSAPAHQSSSILYSCSRLSNTLQTWQVFTSNINAMPQRGDCNVTCEPACVMHGTSKYLFGGFVEGHRSIDQLESVLHFQHKLLPVVCHLHTHTHTHTCSVTVLITASFHLCVPTQVDYYSWIFEIARRKYLFCTVPDHVHVIVVCLE